MALPVPERKNENTFQEKCTPKTYIPHLRINVSPLEDDFSAISSSPNIDIPINREKLPTA